MVDQMQGKALKDPACITPNFDALIDRGVCFENAYAPNAVCSPSRASLMTGLLPHNHGVLHVIHLVDDDQSVIRDQYPHWVKGLKESGYQTAYIGKWHVERSENLKKYGWDHYIPTTNVKTPLIKSRYIKEMEGYPPCLLYGVTDMKPEERSFGISVKHALDSLERLSQTDDPWCLFVSTEEPHDPYVCGKDAYQLYKNQNITLPENFNDTLEGKPNLYKRAAKIFSDLTDQEKTEAKICYYASITEIDQQYGRLLQKLKALDLEDDTIVIFTSDHGDFLGAHGLYQKNISAFEEAYNIPMILAGPKIKPQGILKARVGIHDLYPTILELMGCQAEKYPDSNSFADLLCGKGDPAEWDKGFAEYFGGRIILTQRVVWDKQWKYVFNGFDDDELYNLEEDPQEMRNRINDADCAEIVKHMVILMWSYVKKTGDHSLENINYPILRLAPFGSKME